MLNILDQGENMNLKLRLEQFEPSIYENKLSQRFGTATAENHLCACNWIYKHRETIGWLIAVLLQGRRYFTADFKCLTLVSQD